MSKSERKCFIEIRSGANLVDLMLLDDTPLGGSKLSAQGIGTSRPYCQHRPVFILYLDQQKIHGHEKSSSGQGFFVCPFDLKAVKLSSSVASMH